MAATPPPAPVPPPASAITETKIVDKPLINKPALTANAALTPTPTTAPPPTPLNFKGGFFRSDFTDAGRTATGMAGTFKSTSGWQDGKYYALMNNVPVGTIVKVMDPATSKSIYAKVLGQLPDMKESAGLTIRISSAAANELGAADAKFNVEAKF